MGDTTEVVWEGSQCKLADERSGSYIRRVGLLRCAGLGSSQSCALLRNTVQEARRDYARELSRERYSEQERSQSEAGRDLIMIQRVRPDDGARYVSA